MKSIACCLVLVCCTFVFSACNDSSSPTSTTTNPNTSSYKNISGRISLAVHISGSRNLTLGAISYTKSEEAQANLVFDLPITALSGSSGGKNCSWKDAVFGGSVNWFEELSTEYDCSPGSRATDHDSTTRTFNSASDGAQPGGVSFAMQPDGTYGINLTGAWSGTPTTETRSHAGNCGTPTYTTNTAKIIGVPFENYFSPFSASNPSGGLTGTIDKSNPSRVNGTLHGTDQMTVIDNGTTPVTMPVNYDIIWDLTMTN
ncbi:MAG: hypothetical protein Q8916_11525 [Bacteroidota bacterium]|nr:hypothetical protein [Bacteroidota bacterium]